MLERKVLPEDREHSKPPAPPLLRLATELLAIIISYVPHESLSSFALASKDCCRHARTRQLQNVRFDYSPSSSSLLFCLLREKDSKSIPGKSNYFSSSTKLQVELGAVGPCIRQITVRIHPKWVKHFHDVDSSEEFSRLEREVRQDVLEASYAAQANYLTLVASVVPDRIVLPRLTTLDWSERTPLGPHFLNNLIGSTIQHVKSLSLYNNTDLVLPPISQRWSPKTMHLDLDANWSRLSGDGKATPCSGIIRSCAHSLEHLYWGARNPRGNDKPALGSGLGVPQFKKLRTLALRFSRFTDTELAKALVEAPLSALNIKYCYDDFLWKALSMQGSIPTLDILSCSPRKQSFRQYLRFLRANPQISSLSIFGDCAHTTYMTSLHDTFLEDDILPMLSDSFHNLRSLRLVWKPTVTVVPETAFEIISNITSLEQVCFKAGNYSCWKIDWLVDHEVICNHLSRLYNLKRIAFQGDTYPYDTYLSLDDEGSVRYYERLIPGSWDKESWELDTSDGDAAPGVHQEDLFSGPFEIDTDANDSEYVGPELVDSEFVVAWPAHTERRHMLRMQREASQYAEMMPQLEWIFLGQRDMEIQRLKDGDHCVVPLSERRQDGHSQLDAMFAWEGIPP